ncbi:MULTISPECIES: AbrB/MazE/SpoVT family DNA-binding domain-containing protein [Rhizobium/Agrobacterium group]|uniref:AbrB/MazE/SpoVT family DNA-binding domain-containing protein n=2 Tax=Rhizobium/Agrobacterium group TaxID=227290 RepID=A0AA88F3F2_RHIRH|nr:MULTISPECIES: AbrB/MazE/SpoVT family DNA-binding domain-containing protein [Rhizobium/Agrobacterium group]KAA3504438.1 AbrB/MazE/SpoVT family DNA-binding domain-containing protein [Rhizobium rhizogenes]MBO0129353.1 AbrB/MazE/SpoVT family DNA-binding domain-containing protein [Agrobacterium burrii]MQB08953.1 AbrB/MazE/SpoVT family DNA-binding domain-containing protein [Agrobacterium sp. ICMP 6402]NTZ89610.1 AbrB/MazE/SpoVT family DNA-binding domain-containing protein [Agrobacterium tumefacien
MKATIFEIGEAAGIIIPKDMLERLGWKIGDVLNLRIDGNVLDVRSASGVDEATDDFDRQLEHARSAMRKYHVALKTLAKS